MEFELSAHTKDMLKERKIAEAWLWRTVEHPDWLQKGSDNNVHHFKIIPEYNGRILHVVINANILPNKIVTVFFDRRARRQDEAKSR